MAARESPEQIPLAVQLMIVGHRLAHLLERRLDRLDYNRTQASVIVRLHRHPGLMAQNLADSVAVEPANITRALQALERRGLVERLAHPTDGRASVFHLTGSGGVEAEKLQLLLDKMSAEVEVDLEPEQKRALHEALGKLTRCILPSRGVDQ